MAKKESSVDRIDVAQALQMAWTLVSAKMNLALPTEYVAYAESTAQAIIDAQARLIIANPEN